MIWFLSLISESIVSISLSIGILLWVIGFVLNFLPLIQYRIPAQIISIVLLVPSIWFYSFYHYQEEQRRELLILQERITVAENKSNDLNSQLESKIKELDALRNKKNEVVTRVITKVVKEYDSKCELSNAFIRVHDSASQDKIPSSSEPTDAGTSNVKASEFLQTVTDNYSTYYQMRDRLIQWQKWYNQQKSIYEDISK